MVRTLTILGGGILLGIALSGGASAKVLQYSGRFVESEVLPPSGSSASGVGTFIIDTVANTVAASLTMTGIVGDASPVIHGPAAPGVSAKALFALSEGNSVSTGTWNYDEMFEADILAGLMYVDIHTDLFPAGELRGQILEDCGAGRVNLASGMAQDVLRINGSAGAPGCREIAVAVGASITIACDASNAGPAQGRYVIWAWIGEPANPTFLSAGGNVIGCLANPVPLTAGSPQPFRCLRGGLPRPVCGSVPEVPSPSTVPFSVERASGIAMPITFTLHGIVEDAGAANPLGFSTTNMVVIAVE